METKIEEELCDRLIKHIAETEKEYGNNARHYEHLAFVLIGIKISDLYGSELLDVYINEIKKRNKQTKE